MQEKILRQRPSSAGGVTIITTIILIIRIAFITENTSSVHEDTFRVSQILRLVACSLTGGQSASSIPVSVEALERCICGQNYCGYIGVI